MRRLITLLLSICLIVSMALPGFAAFQEDAPEKDSQTHSAELEQGQNADEPPDTDGVPSLTGTGMGDSHMPDAESGDQLGAAASPETETPGTLLLFKTDSETGEALSGAVFAVHDAATGQELGKITTDSKGQAKMELNEGNYRLTEQTPPEGYQLLKASVPFTIESGKQCEVRVDNHPVLVDPVPDTGWLKVTSKDMETGKALQGAVFAVLDHATGEKLFELTTGSDGVSLQKLSIGRYKLLQTRAPEGYQLNGTAFRFDIAGGETTELTVVGILEEKNPGTLRLTVTAEKTGKALSGAVFGIYLFSDDSKVAEITTGKDGLAVAELAEGQYYLKELETPEGFIRSTDRTMFRITAGKTTDLKVTNKEEAAATGTLELTMRDKESKTRLEGAVFGVYDASGEKLGEIETDRHGFVSLELELGSYHLRGLKAPTGYRLDRAGILFRLTEAKPVAELEVLSEAIEKAEPAQGKVEVYFRRLSDKKEVASMKSHTADVGADYREWMKASGVDRMPVEGYVYVRTDYPEEKAMTEGTLTVTVWYDAASVAIPEIPQTGEALPLLNWTLAALCFGCCGLTAVKLPGCKKKK